MKGLSESIAKNKLKKTLKKMKQRGEQISPWVLAACLLLVAFDNINEGDKDVQEHYKTDTER